MSLPALSLPLPIQRGVEVSRRHFPVAALEMTRTLPVLLRLLPFDDPRCWNLSLLTDGGYPFEFTITTRNDGIRYTTEIAPPKLAPEARLGQAQQCLELLTGTPLPQEPFAWFQRIQKNGTLRYGAWVGVRHHHDESTFKLYVEVPPEGRQLVLNRIIPLLQRAPGVVNRRIELQMVGWVPATGAMEFYFRVEELRPWELVALMHPVGLEAQAPAVLDLFQSAYGRPMYQALPGPIFGFSYALHPAHPSVPSAFSFYTFAETMFGKDTYARQQLQRHFAKVGVDTGFYEDLSATFSDHPHRWTSHGLFGATVSDGVPPVTHIGLRPPRVA